jgi:hypothetical protein
MDATLYTGNGSTQTITNAAAFKPDFVWLKSRSAVGDHGSFDSVRGTTKRLRNNTTNAEDTVSGVTAFNSSGFSLGADYNGSGTTFVGWQWQAGQGTSSSNTNGTITSTVSVNASAGFSVVTWTATNAAATIGHGLGVAPSLIIVKDRAAATNWNVYHASLGNTASVQLNLTNASGASINNWNNTSPTSSVFSVGTFSNYLTDAHVAYCWTPIAGYSAFGSYTGNGSTDGPFVYTGFRPAYIMIKSSSTGGAGYDWFIQDTTRNPANTSSVNHLWADSSVVENDASISTAANNVVDVLSNGFKSRYAGGATNGNGITFIYIAFASNPFKNSLAF